MPSPARDAVEQARSEGSHRWELLVGPRDVAHLARGQDIQGMRLGGTVHHVLGSDRSGASGYAPPPPSHLLLGMAARQQPQRPLQYGPCTVASGPLLR